MSLQGPILIVAATPRADLIGTLEKAGAFPIVEVRPGEAEQAVASVRPSAVLVAGDCVDHDALDGLAAQQSVDDAIVPIIALLPLGEPVHPAVLPVDETTGTRALAALIRAVARVRTLHLSVLRRMRTAREQNRAPVPFPEGDPLEDATALVAGRGGGYPALTTAVGERLGLIGALSLDIASGYLGSRDVDALVVGDGFNRNACMNLVASLGSDPRFRDLPIIVSGPIAASEIDPERLPFLQRVDSGPADVVARLVPYARLHAFSSRQKRMLAALDANGVLDAETGLYTREVFVRDFSRAVNDAESRGVSLAVARFALDNLTDQRTSRDAARLVGRLVRAGDFACRDRDGTILVAFSETDLGTANVVARRIASVLKHTVLAPGCDRAGLVPTVTLAGLKNRDTAATLLARVTPSRAASAD